MYFYSTFSFLILFSNHVFAISYLEDLTLTFKQKELLDQFKERVLPILPNKYMQAEIYLSNWLRSSDWDVNLAQKRLVKNLKWREEQKIDKIQLEDWSDLKNDYKFSIEGRDKAGRPFLYFDVKTVDVRRQIILGKGERLLRYVDKSIEEACVQIRELGEKYGNITRGDLLVNADGYNTAQHGCLRCIPLLEHWPECLDKVIVVNTPAIAEPILGTLIPLANSFLNQRINVYGTNRNVWKKALAQDFDFGQLPPSIGGTMIHKGLEEHYSEEDNEAYLEILKIK